MQMQQYFAEIERKVKVLYSIAGEARKKGFDPKNTVEIPLATSLAEKVTGLVSIKYGQVKDPKIEKRIAELEEIHGLLNPAVSLIIAEEIANEKFCKFKDKMEAIDAAIRIGLAYTTLGVVSSPLEGFTDVKLQKTKTGEDYFCLYFSGPIRSAGGTAAAFSVLLSDYLRSKFGYSKYDPTEDEVKRTITEIQDYHDYVTNLQYLPSPQEIEILARNVPLQISGEPSEKREVSQYKDLPRIETNFIRSGICLTIAEGILQKAAKLSKIIKGLEEKGFSFPDWKFLADITKLQKKDTGAAKPQPSFNYIKDLVAGRPILSHPSREGAFRLRYGRTRTSGYSAVAIHPATMLVLGNFIALGTQLRTERPGKSAAIVSCDTIDASIVKLNNGSVLRLKTTEQASRIAKDVAEIIYLGDILVSYGDFFNRNHVLMPSAYNEDVWHAELHALLTEKGKEKETEDIDKNAVAIEQAQELSTIYGIPLHPEYIFYWTQIKPSQLGKLLDWLCKARVEEKLILPYSASEIEEYAEEKRALELLGVEHQVSIENVVISSIESKALLLNLGIAEFDKELLKEQVQKLKAELQNMHDTGQETLDVINMFSAHKIRDKAGTFIGTRMGRPEKAKLRVLTGSPNVLFPVGEEGGRLRSVQEATESSVKAEFPIYACDTCNKDTIYYVCEQCGKETRQKYYCRFCDRTLNTESCHLHGLCQRFMQQRIDIKHYLTSAMKLMSWQRAQLPPLIKGVRGTSSGNHIPEHLGKGILRAMFNLSVNKDGTIRYDATELPITHFKPKEVGTSLEKLRELGYTKDIHDKPLTDKDQVLEIKPHDIILPLCPDSLDENADIVFMNVAKFIDNLLVRLYGMRTFYDIKSREDLAGQLVGCIAPHNSAAVVGRIVGFSKMQALLASPYIHAAMRRDADGDEAAIMLLSDMLLNFSREFLPSHRGGTQDAPLILNARLRAGEVDDMVFDIETVTEFPLELYQAAQDFKPAYSVKVQQIKARLGDENATFAGLNFTHDTSDINAGVTCSAYKKLATMQEKVQKSMELCERIRATDTDDVARLVIERHLIRDIKGNLRQFSMQQFRCVKCNDKYRRPPLQGTCTKCGGRLLFTISEGGIIKYLEPALQLATKYNVPAYVKHSIELTKSYIESIFGKEKEKQQDLEKWF